ncbi:hypothetical protein A3H09_02590 [Candidatus Falkowbacteria bacterium RIFCSPLOWO2_12_FULL_45_13]|uniref:DNA helicase UvrD n=1 Tax=Candidatus Falkowbacteria bacterium RIFCSPLOWO2_12_FULL_45_13 TaxID=1797991 RepID=A0A1F5SUY3_9BACT|nr:MAG: hypothetical protein A3H09_02590 [Candidatus Falkowbacteria bacterium RIFCSPLOWO2_12_FULL_45_13]
MQQILDLHIHSKYSRSCSPELTLSNIDAVCRTKGVDIIATGDFTYPEWFSDIKNKLEEIPPFNLPLSKGENGDVPLLMKEGVGGGLYKLKRARDDKVKFILSTEVALIYKDGGKVRRIHLVIHAPSLEAAEELNEYLDKDFNIRSDGRPILGMSAPDLMKLCLGIDQRFLIYPAHIWTPWFAVFGSKSGFDKMEECFHEYAKNVYAIETGLSSDPEMNWRLSALDKLTILSNSDAHSLPNIAREANVFEMKNISYDEIYEIIKNKKIYKGMNPRPRYAESSGGTSPRLWPTAREASLRGDDKRRGGSGDNSKNIGVKYTIEFYPEEGMYHYDGHRACGVSFTPEQTKKHKGVCPVCKKSLTIGVMNRVDELADRPAFASQSGATAGKPASLGKTNRVAMSMPALTIADRGAATDITAGSNPPLGQAGFVKLVELDKIIAEAMDIKSRQSGKVQAEYRNLIKQGGNELNILLNISPEDLGKMTDAAVAEGIKRVRQGRLIIKPGFDGQYGEIRIFDQQEKKKNQQKSLFEYTPQ